jgi:hypothetical protein
VLAILPTTSTFEVTFTTTDAPLAVEITRGSNTSADLAVRYLDLALPESQSATLTLSPGGVGDLVLDSDGDDIFETKIDHSLSLTGQEANDLQRPELSVSANGLGEKVFVALHAKDAGSGVKQVLFSLDGVNYQPYTEPLELEPDVTPYLYAFADDHVGNRTAIAYDLTHPVLPAFAIYLPMVIGPPVP